MATCAIQVRFYLLRPASNPMGRKEKSGHTMYMLRRRDKTQSTPAPTKKHEFFDRFSYLRTPLILNFLVSTYWLGRHTKSCSRRINLGICHATTCRPSNTKICTLKSRHFCGGLRRSFYGNIVFVSGRRRRFFRSIHTTSHA